MNEPTESKAVAERSWLGSLEWTYIRVRHPVVIVCIPIAIALAVLLFKSFSDWRERGAARDALAEARQAVYLASPLVVDEEVRPLLAEAEAELERAEASYLESSYQESHSRSLTAMKLAERAIQEAEVGGWTSPPAHFLRLQGEVRVRPKGDINWQQATISRPLQPGDLIRTFSGSAAEIVYEDGRITTMSSGSMMQIQAIRQAEQAIHVKETIEAGSIRIISAPGVAKASTHTVQTDLADVRAEAPEADLRVSLQEDGREVALDVYRGSVTVGSDDAAQAVKAGTRSLVGADGRVLKTTDLLSSPHLYSPAEAHLFWVKSPEEGIVTLAWSEVDGASTYEVEVGRHSLLASPEFRLDSHRGTTAKVNGLRPGWWFWRVRGLDGTGTPGLPSITGSFRLERAKPQPGAGSGEGPLLELTRVMQAGQVFILVGRSSPGARITIDGGPAVIPEEDGRFTGAVQLQEPGLHRLVVRATDVYGRERVVEREVYLVE